MEKNVLLTTTKKASYTIDPLGKIAFQNSTLSKMVNSVVGTDPFQDLLWNAGCMNTEC